MKSLYSYTRTSKYVVPIILVSIVTWIHIGLDMSQLKQVDVLPSKNQAMCNY